MGNLTKYFLSGILTLLPFGLTVYIFVVIIMWSENMSKKLFSYVIKDFYIPGIGLVLALGLVVFLGFIISRPFFNKLFKLIELPFNNVPLVKSIYNASKSLSEYFSPKKDGEEQQVVLVKMPSVDMELVGFLTRENLKDTDLEIDDPDKVAVYFPLSYQIGGYTCFIPRSWVRKIDISVESAMGQSLTAWMPSKSSND